MAGGGGAAPAWAPENAPGTIALSGQLVIVVLVVVVVEGHLRSPLYTNSWCNFVTRFNLPNRWHELFNLMFHSRDTFGLIHYFA